jgi:hypothetical protein
MDEGQGTGDEGTANTNEECKMKNEKYHLCLKYEFEFKSMVVLEYKVNFFKILNETVK